MPDLLLLISQIIVILVATRLTGRLLELVGQPRVIGEMVAGFLLGPSLLGALAPELWQSLFPAQSLGFLSALSQIGLVFFMFLIGLELDLALLKGQSRAAVMVSNAGIAIPLVSGVALATFLYPRLASSDVTTTAFALFVGVAMSVTAFPVLARILTDRDLLRTRPGSVALAAAAVDDVTAWCLLAVVVAVARSGASPLPLPVMFLGSALFAVLMLTVGRRVLQRLMPTSGTDLRQGYVALVVLLVLGSAWLTERLGVHAVFGAFLAGVAMPRDERLAGPLRDRLHDLMVILFVPLFFAFTGLRTNIAMIGGAAWTWTLLIIVVAVAGKLGGATLAARAGGMAWREALAVGTLMNTRGLMELVVLNVGLDIGVISPAVFAMFVIMALVTTFMTSPILSLVHPTLKAGAGARVAAPPVGTSMKP